MNYTFTERHAIIASRFVDVHIDKWLEEMEALKKLSFQELNDHYDSINTLLITTFAIKYRSEKNTWFELSVQYDYDEPESASYGVSLNSIEFSLSHNTYDLDRKKCLSTLQISRYTFTSIEELKKWINAKVKTYTQCKCTNFLADKDGWCSYCYPYVMEQDDNCSVCLENSGVWVELKCEHKIHEYCFKKIENKKCPLCRKVSDKTFKL